EDEVLPVQRWKPEVPHVRTCHGQNTNQRKAAEIWQSARTAQRTSFSVVASCGLLPRTTRPGPRLRTAFPAVAKYNVSYVSGPTQAECHPELAKDPQLVASSAWVADPSTSLAGSLRSG